MRETGIIISQEKDQATVQMARGEKCDGCNLCSMAEDGRMRVTALNKINAGVGDMVEVEIPPGKIVGYSMLLFIMPILMMILGYFAGKAVFTFSHGESSGILGSIGGLVLSFVIIRLIDRRFASTTNPATIINRLG